MFCRHSSPPISFVLLILAIFSLPIQAATFTVTNLDDSGSGSLRQAVLNANASTGDDVIIFQSGLTGTITLTSGQLTISGNLTINGLGANVLAISGNRASSIFLIDWGNIVMDRLTLKEGYSNSAGAIKNNGSLTITNSDLSNNDAVQGGGGAITNYGILIVANSTLSSNSAKGAGGAIYSIMPTGWPIQGRVVINNSTLSNNSSLGCIDPFICAGGAITTVDHSLAIFNSTLSGNSAEDWGGAIWALRGSVVLGNSLFAGNLAPQIDKKQCDQDGSFIRHYQKQ